jgi:hypothetical protein
MAVGGVSDKKNESRNQKSESDDDLTDARSEDIARGSEFDGLTHQVPTRAAIVNGNSSQGIRNIAKIHAAAPAESARFRILCSAFWTKHLFKRIAKN